jgi:hypothetical protein
VTPPERRAEDLLLAEFQGEIRQFMKDIKDDVAEIKKQTTETNGRVNALETDAAVQADRDGRKTANRTASRTVILAVAGLCTTLLASCVAVLLTHFLGS